MLECSDTQFENSWRVDLAQGILGNQWDTLGPQGPSAVSMASNANMSSTQSASGEQRIPRIPPPPKPAPKSVDSSRKHSTISWENGFQDWLLAEGITKNTVDVIGAQGFTSKRILGGLQPEDPSDMGIQSLGQRRLLQLLATSCLKDGDDGVPDQSSKPADQAQQFGSGDPLQGQLAALFAAMPTALGSDVTPPTIGSAGLPIAGATGHSSISPGERVDLNPLNYLFPSQNVKYKDITEYLGPVDTGEHVVDSADGTQVVFRTGPRKPKLETVSPMQWCAANLKIMVDLLRERTLTQRSVMDYIAYTIKVAELANKFTWLSVLQYDQTYRRMQQMHQFRWASDSPHLTSVYLVPRVTVAKGPSVKAPRPHKTAPICRNFNRGECAFSDCKYQHICSLPNCGKPHPQSSHSQPPKNA